MTNIFKNIYGNLLGFFKLGSSRWSKEVGAGKDYTTIALGVADLENKVVNSPVLTLAAGDYNEIILDGTENLLTNTLELVGDVRDIAGACYMDEFTIFSDSNNGGSGTCAIVNGGNNITITGTTTNPDFDAAGVVAGDKVLIHNNAGAFAEYIIQSCLNNLITLTVTAPAVGNSGTSVTFLPNRKIWHATAGLVIIDNIAIGNIRNNKPIAITLRGFYLQAQANNIINVNGNVSITLEKCTLDKYGNTITACHLNHMTTIIGLGKNNSIQNNSTGTSLLLNNSSKTTFCYINIIKCGKGVYNGLGGFVNISFIKITHASETGIYTNYQGMSKSEYAEIKNSLTAIHSRRNSFIEAAGADAGMSNNTTDYSPAISLTPGNEGSYIFWS